LKRAKKYWTIEDGQMRGRGKSRRGRLEKKEESWCKRYRDRELICAKYLEGRN
jgi:hypothetical protein